MLLLFACQPKETCSIEDIMFQKPKNDSLYSMSFDEFWNAGDELDSIICEKGIYWLEVKGYELFCPYIVECGEPIISCGQRSKNILELKVSAEGIKGRDTLYPFDSLVSLFKSFYFNNGKNPRWSDSPQKAIIGLGWDSSANAKNVERAIETICNSFVEIRKSVIPADSNACDFYRNNRREIIKKYPAKLWINRDRTEYRPILPPIIEEPNLHAASHLFMGLCKTRFPHRGIVISSTRFIRSNSFI